jgi:multisubunit Na+/H+ antiporter MnhC subunit
MWRKVTSRGLQLFAAGALASKGFSAWIGFAWSLSVGSTKNTFIWALVGMDLLMAIGLLIGSKAMVRAVQSYLLFYVTISIVIIATGGPRDPRYPHALSMTAFIIGMCENAILLFLLLWSSSKTLTNATYSSNQSLEPTAGRHDAHV